ncbi:hypothetical protein WG909_11505 [Peptostreptococcaceae bacterium AGR-M142]
MRLRYGTIFILIFIIIFGGISILKIQGKWDVATGSIPSKIVVDDSGTDIEAYDPSQIRGSTKFTQLSEWFDIPIEILGEAFNVPEEKWETIINKDLHDMYEGYLEEDQEIGNGSVKYFIALYKNLPYELEDDEIEYLPKKAVEILKRDVNLDDETIKKLEEYSIELPDLKN